MAAEITKPLPKCAPPNRADGTVHKTKAEVDAVEPLNAARRAFASAKDKR